MLLVVLPVLPAQADWDGNASKTYILGTTDREKEALRAKRKDMDVPIPQRKPDTIEGGVEIDLNRHEMFDELEEIENREPILDYQLINPNAQDILRQIEQ